MHIRTHRVFACNDVLTRVFACPLRAALRAKGLSCVPLRAGAFVPIKREIEAWEQRLRESVREQCPFGYSIRPMSGRIQVQRYWRDSGKRETVTLPLEWHPSSQRALLNGLHQINLGLNNGLSLKAAAGMAFDVAQSTGAGDKLNWGEVLRKFKEQKLDDGIKASTWDREYQTRLGWLIDQLNSPSGPNNGTNALKAMRVGRNGHGDEPGSRGRRLRIQYAAQILGFAVRELGVDQRWQPPDAAEIAGIIGKKSSDTPSAANAGQAHALTDEQFLRLFDSITNPSWKLAIGLVGVFGLRGVELNYASAKPDGLRVEYRKVTARGKTDPRTVPILDPKGRKGLGQQLLLTLHSGIVNLPPLGSSDSEASGAISTFLRRNKVWQQLKDEVRLDSGDRVSVYSLRHGFAWRCAMAEPPVNPRAAAAAMGHTFQTHVQIYGRRFDFDQVQQAFERASRENQVIELHTNKM
jgi:integrase